MQRQNVSLVLGSVPQNDIVVFGILCNTDPCFLENVITDPISRKSQKRPLKPAHPLCRLPDNLFTPQDSELTIKKRF